MREVKQYESTIERDAFIADVKSRGLRLVEDNIKREVQGEPEQESLVIVRELVFTDEPEQPVTVPLTLTERIERLEKLAGL